MADRRWAQAVMPRGQQWLHGCLDDLVTQNHPIRLVDAVLNELDWSEWEGSYSSERRGQPPLHPRLLAGCILYGLLRKLRSSRQLEDATRERLDFQWFLEGRTIDHSTFADFRVAFAEKLKELNRAFARRVVSAHEGALETLVVDGTRIRACSDRHGARTAETLERMIQKCAQVLNERLATLEETDEREAVESRERGELRQEIERLRSQLEHYEKAAAVAHERDAQRRKKEGKNARPVSVPVNDPDSSIVPNKEGGFAPNYTPAVVVDAASGAIVLGDVPEGSQENTVVMPGVEEARHLGGEPKRVLADTAFGCGENLAQLDAQDVEACMPTGTDFRSSNPANRPDPTQPVPEDQWDQLPMANGKLRASAFVYDAERDEYRCPIARALTPQHTGHHRSGAAHVTYACPGREGCPLADRCIGKDASRRTLARDEYQDLRDKAGRNLATEEGSALYKKRAPLVEVVFARIKGQMGIRDFLLRGLDKVRCEWNWVCCAYNLKLILQMMQETGKRPENTPPEGPSSAHTRLQSLFSRAVDAILTLNVRGGTRCATAQKYFDASSKGDTRVTMFAEN